MATVPAAKPKVETVSTRQLASQLAEKHELSQKSANAMLEDVIGLDHQASQEGRPHPSQWPGHPGRAQARSAHGPQSRDRRSDQDQGFQEGRVPRLQGAEGSDLDHRFSDVKERPGAVRPAFSFGKHCRARLSPCPQAHQRLGSARFSSGKGSSHGAQENRPDRRRTNRRHARPSGGAQGIGRCGDVRHRRRPAAGQERWICPRPARSKASTPSSRAPTITPISRAPMW